MTTLAAYTQADPEHIQQLLKSKFVQNLDQSLKSRLPGIVKALRCEEGQVLFREGDPVGNWYFITRGAVGVYALVPRKYEGDHVYESETADSETVHSSSINASYGQVEPARDLTCTFPARKGHTGTERLTSLEGFSSYSVGEPLGSFVATLTSGQLFGELAHISATRHATLVCISDSEFLVISREDFGALGRDQREKVETLKTHVPGFRDLPKPESWANHFQFAAYPKGHIFLQQDEVAVPAVWVLCEGSVEFFYRAPATTAQGFLACGPRLAGPCSGKNHRRDFAAVSNHCVGVLLSGGLFGASPSSAPEMFTVSVAAACKVFHLPRAAMKRLPQTQLDSINAYIIESTIKRLGCCIKGHTARSTLKHGPLLGVANSEAEVRKLALAAPCFHMPLQVIVEEPKQRDDIVGAMKGRISSAPSLLLGKHLEKAASHAKDVFLDEDCWTPVESPVGSPRPIGSAVPTVLANLRRTQSASVRSQLHTPLLSWRADTSLGTRPTSAFPLRGSLGGDLRTRPLRSASTSTYNICTPLSLSNSTAQVSGRDEWRRRPLSAPGIRALSSP